MKDSYLAEEIRRVKNNDPDFLLLVKKLDDIHNEVVAEQRSPNANCLNHLDNYTTVLIMYVDDKPSGCASITDVIDEEVEIGRVVVLEEYRGRGIATKLLLEIEKIAKEKGAKAMILDTYNRLSNAVSLYKKLGFKEVEHFPWLSHSPYSICMRKYI